MKNQSVYTSANEPTRCQLGSNSSRLHSNKHNSIVHKDCCCCIFDEDNTRMVGAYSLDSSLLLERYINTQIEVKSSNRDLM